MNCHEVRKTWHDRFDGGAAGAGVEEHLQCCATCRAYFRQMDSLAAALSGLAQDTQTIVSTRAGEGRGGTGGEGSVIVVTPRPGSIRRDILRRLLRPGALVRAAAVIGLMIAGGWYVWTRPGSGPAGQDGALVKGPDGGEGPLPWPSRGDGGTSESSRESADFESGVAKLSLSGDSAFRYVAVEAPSTRSNVTLYWLYPTLADGA